MTEVQRALMAAHQGNVRRYRRMLGTYLTDFERQFVEHRLFEEEDAIRQLRGAPVPGDRGDDDRVALRYARRAAAH